MRRHTKAAIAASLSSVFNWKENWIRVASTLELLVAEHTKYRTRTSAAYDVTIDDQQALSNFVDSLTSLNVREMSEWRSLQNKRIETKSATQE